MATDKVYSHVIRGNSMYTVASEVTGDGKHPGMTEGMKEGMKELVRLLYLPFQCCRRHK
ncbi:hypothetical protein ACJMK2_013396, partial [Sinanodonta woodiana]